MDRHASAIIEGIYASTEGAADVALVERVLADVRLEVEQAAFEMAVDRAKTMGATLWVLDSIRELAKERAGL
jgi:hypothetical protein